MVVVEDAGALAYLAGVPQAIQSLGFSVRVLACGHLADQCAGVRDCVPVFDADRVESMVWSAQPAAVVVGTCENLDAIGHTLTQSAKGRGIVSVGLVDGPANAAYRFRGRTSIPLAYAPDWLAVPDDRTRDRFLELGAPPTRVRTCGHPGLDLMRAFRGRLNEEQRIALRNRLWPGRGDRHVVVFATELSSGLNDAQFRSSSEYTLFGVSGSTLRTDIVLEEFLRAANDLHPRPYLVLRLHPKSTQEMFRSYLGDFDACSAKESTIDVLQAADAVVGLTSVILDEALILGRPVISIVPCQCETEWLRGAALGLIPVVSRREAIAPALAAAIGRRGVAKFTTIDQLIPHGAAGNVATLIDGAIRATSSV
jgi:hypothetical protein